MKCKFCSAETNGAERCPECGHKQKDFLITKYLPRNFTANVIFLIFLIVLIIFYSSMVNFHIGREDSLTEEGYNYGLAMYRFLQIFSIVSAVGVLLYIIIATGLKLFNIGKTAKSAPAAQNKKHVRGSFITEYKYVPLSHIFFFFEIILITVNSMTNTCIEEGYNDFPVCKFLYTAYYDDWAPFFGWFTIIFSVALFFTALFLVLNLTLGFTLYENRIIGKGAMMSYVSDLWKYFSSNNPNKKSSKPKRRVDFDLEFNDIYRIEAHGRSIIIYYGTKRIRVIARNGYEAEKVVKYINDKKNDKQPEFFEKPQPLFSL